MRYDEEEDVGVNGGDGGDGGGYCEYCFDTYSVKGVFIKLLPHSLMIL